MELFSHNTMSYLPCQWWLRPIAWMGRCQNKTLQEQYNNGARHFDIRLAFDSFGNPYFAHGIFRYKISSAYEVIDWLKVHAKSVRVILEADKHTNDEFHFRIWCNRFKIYNLPVYCGKRKSDCKEIFHFDMEGPEVKHLYSSETAWCKWLPELDDLCPWLYAKFHNKKTLEQYKDTDGIIAIDFI